MQPTPTERKDVMLAEDDHDDVVIFVTALNNTKIPCDFRHAKDGDELFVELKKAVPNLLFLDIQMPCKDGLSCILEIRKNRKYDRMPVVMFTSFTQNNYVEKAYRYGANYYVTKPASVESLTRRLQQLLSMETGRQLYFPPRHEFVLS